MSYKAAADVFEKDPMAKHGPLSLKEIAKRDEMVFSMIQGAGWDSCGYLSWRGCHSMEVTYTNSFEYPAFKSLLKPLFQHRTCL